MSAILSLFQSEPSILWAGLVAAVFNAVIIFLPSFGVHLTAEEQAALAVIVNALIALIVRSQVSPIVKPGVSSTGPAVSP